MPESRYRPTSVPPYAIVAGNPAKIIKFLDIKKNDYEEGNCNLHEPA